MTARLPIVGDDTGQWGSLLNQFLAVAHNPDGTLINPGFANPMQATGDLITGGPNGIATKLPIGPSGFFLGIAGGQPVWLPVPSGFQNPMNTLGDIITGAASGIAQRLGIGGAGQVLGSNGSIPGWVTNPAGFTNPMTAQGDVITGGVSGAAQRLAIGALNQVLAVTSATALGWVNNPAGFANPMTASQDLIVGGTGGAATRFPIGANGQFLGISSGLLQYQNVPSSPFEVLTPSGDTTGTADDTAFNNAIAALPRGGVIYLLPSSTSNVYYTKNGWVPPAQTSAVVNGNTNGGNPVCVQGIGIIQLSPVGANKTGISYHRTSTYGAQFNNPAQPFVGFIRDIWITGVNATSASIGIDVGDGWGYDISVYVSDFTGTGAIGANLINRVFWSEKNSMYRIHSSNNTTAIVFDSTVGDISKEYNFCDFVIFCNQNQNGITIQNGVNVAGCFMFIRGNMCQTTATSGTPTNNTSMLKLLGAGTRMYFGQLWCKVEFNQTAQFPTGSVAPWTIYSDGNGKVQQCSGQITTSMNGIQTNGAEFSFSGMIDAGDIPPVNGGSGLTASNLWPTLPVLGSSWVNKGPDAVVAVAGGSITDITLNGTDTLIAATNVTVPVPAGGKMQVNGSGATLTVIPARYSSA